MSGLILLTGATGFIGSVVARVLVEQGHEVGAMVRNANQRGLDNLASLRIVEGDLSRLDELEGQAREIRVDTLVHLAWSTVPGQYLSDLANFTLLEQSLQLFSLARRIGVRRIVGVGTCFEYDSNYGYLGENTPLRPATAYSSAKAALYLATRGWAREAGVSFAWARVFYVYGPGEKRQRLVPLTICSLKQGKAVAITSGRQVRDYLHVYDVARAIASLALSDAEGPVNVGAGEPILVRDLVMTIAERMGRPELVELGALPDRPDDPPFICARVGRLRDELGWIPSFSLAGGLADTIAWWQRDG